MTLVSLLALSISIGSIWGLAEAYKKSKWFWFFFINSLLVGLVIARPEATDLVAGVDFAQIILIVIPQQIGRWATRLYFERVKRV